MQEYIFLRYANEPNEAVSQLLKDEIVKPGTKLFFTALPGIMITLLKTELTESQMRGKLDTLDILYDVFLKKTPISNRPTSTTNNPNRPTKAELEEKLNQAIESEQYEIAARLRNQIASLYGPATDAEGPANTSESMITSLKFFRYLNENSNENQFLTDIRKREILDELNVWSGGYDPTEMEFDSSDDNDEQTLNQFMDNYIDKNERQTVEEWFIDLQNGDDTVINYLELEPNEEDGKNKEEY